MFARGIPNEFQKKVKLTITAPVEEVFRLADAIPIIERVVSQLDKF